MVDTVLIERLITAALLGSLLGLERSLAGKHAGMRTYALVSMGSCLFVVCGILSSYAFMSFPGVNPMLIGSNVVVAIGFLGVGLTVFRGDHPAELTTAAGLWVAAGVGMASGFGFYSVAIATVVIAAVVFSILLKLENSIRKKYGTGGD